jgi:DNA-binding GntR family transcriptional regulator
MGKSSTLPQKAKRSTATRELLVDRVYEYLRARLAARQLPLGSHLNGKVVAEQLSVSRTPVNQAIARLTRDGYLRADQSRRPVVVAYPARVPGAAEVQFAFANQTEHTYQAVLERIVRGDYPPGEVFKVTRLARELHVNPVTIYRAAEWLCNDGLLVRLPRRGWQVLTLRPAEWKDLYQVREQLEVLAVRGAVDRMAEEKLDELEAETRRLLNAGDKAPPLELQQADLDFHRGLAAASGSRVLAATLEPLLRKSFLLAAAAARLGHKPCRLGEHLDILEALRRGDEADAVKRLKAHLRASMERTVGIWERVG